MSISRSIHVLGIDWQNDFCDPKGALYVDGAHADAGRMAEFIRRIGPFVSMFHMTLDSHQGVHIAHAEQWLDRDGKHPALFTVITNTDVKSGVYRAANPRKQSIYANYVEELTRNNRYPLRIWPRHCLIGTPGHNVEPRIWRELDAWATAKQSMINYVTKGSNPDTEHYSALMADVPVPTDPTTKINADLLKFLAMADELVITGQASSHCVANTVRDIAAKFSPEQVRKFVIIKDLMSPVPIAKADADQFFSDMLALGVRIVDKSTDYR